MNKSPTRSAKEIGNTIREARKTLGLTQGELAAKSGLWQETISKIENGESGTKIETILSILAALDLELAITQRTKDETNFEDIF